MATDAIVPVKHVCTFDSHNIEYADKVQINLFLIQVLKYIIYQFSPVQICTCDCGIGVCVLLHEKKSLSCAILCTLIAIVDEWYISIAMEMFGQPLHICIATNYNGWMNEYLQR